VLSRQIKRQQGRSCPDRRDGAVRVYPDTSTLPPPLLHSRAPSSDPPTHAPIPPSPDGPPLQVRITCESGCKCKPVTMDGKNKTPTSELHTERMPISPHKE
jgi:hypothetical protein